MMKQPRRPFTLHRLRVKAWQLRKLPADQRRQAGKDLLSEIKNYLDKLDGTDLPRSDL